MGCCSSTSFGLVGTRSAGNGMWAFFWSRLFVRTLFIDVELVVLGAFSVSSTLPWRTLWAMLSCSVPTCATLVAPPFRHCRFLLLLRGQQGFEGCLQKVFLLRQGLVETLFEDTLQSLVDREE